MARGDVQFPDDLDLMQAVARGDRGALSTLYDRYSPMLLSLCRRVLRDQADAEEVLIDVWFEVWSRADRFDASRGNALTYLVTLTRSRAIDRQRSRASRPRTVSDENAAGTVANAGSTPLDTVELTEQRARVRDALSGLEPIQREVIECSYYEGLSHSQIAARLNRPLGSIKTYIRQGLIQLRNRLRND